MCEERIDAFMVKLLKWVGWIVIAFGLVAGIFGSKVPVLKQSSFKTVGTYLDSEFSWTLFFTYIIGGALTGLIFLALASILERTEQNNDYLYELIRRTPIERE